MTQKIRNVGQVESGGTGSYVDTTGAVMDYDGTDANFGAKAAGGGTVGANLWTMVAGVRTKVAAMAGAIFAPKGLLDLSAATAGQIKFPTTENPSADLNTFTDYRVNTSFVPLVTFGGTSVGMTFNIQRCKYIKTGGVVHFEIQFRFTAKGSSTGVAAVSLPVASGATYVGVCQVYPETAITFTDSLWGRIAAGGSSCQLMHNNAGAGDQLTHAAFTDTSNVVITGFYFA